MAFIFEKLKVYQRALELAAVVDILCGDLPKGTYFLAHQLRRASLSMSLNIAEVNGRWHKADRRQFFAIARGSAYECVPILELLSKNGSIDSEVCGKLKAEIDEICKMIAGLIRGLEKQENRE